MPPNHNEINTNVSELMLYLKCPRQVYFTNRGHDIMSEITPSYLEHLMLKELAMTYPDVLKQYTSKDDMIAEQLKAEFNRLKDDIELIYSSDLRNTDPAIIDQAWDTISNELGGIAEKLSASVLELGKEELLSRIIPSQTEPLLHSERLKLNGIPTAMVNYRETPTPLVIKTGRCPDSGVWRNDRMHIAALSMLVEEQHNAPIDYGFVEYARHGTVRRVKIRSGDRRQVLNILKRIEIIKDGSMPDKKESGFCDVCNFSQKCSPRASLASRFF